MLTCSVNLRPLTWHQSVEHYTSINVEGRRFLAKCAVERGSDLRLSNEMRLEELPVEILIFETSQMQDELGKLPEGVLGVFSFFDASPEMDAFLSGWFVLNVQSLEDAWNQVGQGGYSECRIGLSVGPVESAQGMMAVGCGQAPASRHRYRHSLLRAIGTDAWPNEEKKSFWRR